MPECLLMAYHDQMPRLRASRMLDAAQVAMYPHSTKQYAQRWIDRLVGQAQRVMQEAIDSEFKFNGEQVSLRGLVSRLSSALGGGFRSD